MTQDNNNYHQKISNTSNKPLGIDDSWIEKIWKWADEF